MVTSKAALVTSRVTAGASPAACGNVSATSRSFMMNAPFHFPNPYPEPDWAPDSPRSSAQRDRQTSGASRFTPCLAAHTQGGRGQNLEPARRYPAATCLTDFVLTLRSAPQRALHLPQ